MIRLIRYLLSLRRSERHIVASPGYQSQQRALRERLERESE